jgi:hypothetical protein
VLFRDPVERRMIVGDVFFSDRRHYVIHAGLRALRTIRPDETGFEIRIVNPPSAISLSLPW